MCLRVTSEPENKARHQDVLDSKSIVVAYKVVTVGRRGLKTQYQNKPIKPGWFKSNRRTKFVKITKIPPNLVGMIHKPLSSAETGFGWSICDINRGIHVYLKERHANTEAGDRLFLSALPVVCSVKDLVATGTFGGLPSAVFTKVFVRKADWLKALNCHK